MPKNSPKDKFAHAVRDSYLKKGDSMSDAERIGHMTVNKKFGFTKR